LVLGARSAGCGTKQNCARGGSAMSGPNPVGGRHPMSTYEFGLSLNRFEWDCGRVSFR
jgi:hypothetical protein